ncbi:hypothetical protein MJK72_10450 [Klebsiella pneumoniae]|nr:hypothetical protein MJK72_10450 [Klebsiella pneumoniae]
MRLKNNGGKEEVAVQYSASGAPAKPIAADDVILFSGASAPRVPQRG